MEAYLNGEFLPLDRAHLHVSDLSIQRGYGIFDFFRVKSFVPLYLEDYLNRFYISAETMGLQEVITRVELREVIIQLIARNKVPDAGMKIIFTGGYSPDAYHPEKGNLLVSEHPLILPSEAQVEKGVSIITYPYRRDIPEVKTINYIMGVWLQRKVREAQAVDVLYYQEGLVSEFPRCNFFLVTKNGTLVTPDQFVLPGITRMRVLEAARRDFKMEERSVKLEEIYEASEAFMTSTTKGVLPVVKIDNRIIGTGVPGPLSKTLRKLLVQREQEEIGKSKAIVGIP